ncbi:MAG: response regulator [SAR324 cluster bacterium]|nr:response regulator [SAR324 cluster bacterium]
MSSKQSDSPSENILVVDDTPENLHLLVRILEGQGYMVRPAPNGRLALSGAMAIPPDLILLDIKMPEMDGYEVCSQLKSDEKTANVPIIFISALHESMDKVKGFSAGGVDFITKPFQKDEVLARVKTHLALRNVQKELEYKNTLLTQEIADRKEIEEELRKYQNQLEELVSTRTAELTASNQRLQKLGAHQEAVREEERTRIAREIHDELGQVLTALKMDTVWLQKHLLEEKPALQQKTSTMLELIVSTIKTVQKISRDLRPGLLDDLGLAAAIEWQTQEFGARTEIECQLDLASDEILDLPPDLTTALFRIFQEILTNIARHAQATWISVNLLKQSQQLRLTIIDDGVGIQPAQAVSSDSFGLMGIRERLYPWQGTFEVTGISNQGTTAIVKVPLESIERKKQ